MHLYISFWISPYSRYRHEKAAQWYHIWDSVGKSLILSMLLPGRVFRILYISSCFCLWIFNFMLDYIARNAPSAFSYSLHRLIIVFMSRLSGGYYTMSYSVFASLTIAISFSNSNHFLTITFRSRPCPSGKVVNIWKWFSERYTPFAGEPVSS